MRKLFNLFVPKDHGIPSSGYKEAIETEIRGDTLSHKNKDEMDWKALMKDYKHIDVDYIKKYYEEIEKEIEEKTFKERYREAVLEQEEIVKAVHRTRKQAEFALNAQKAADNGRIAHMVSVGAVIDDYRLMAGHVPDFPVSGDYLNARGW